MEQNELQRALMAILFAAGEPVAASRLSESLAVDEAQIHEELKYLMDQLSFHRSGIRIVRLEDAYQMCSAAEQAELVTKTLETRKPPKLSPRISAFCFSSLANCFVSTVFPVISRQFCGQICMHLPKG